MRSCIVTWSVFCLEISSFMTLLYASVLWFCHLFGGFPRPAATRTGRNMHFFILSDKGRRRPSLEWSHLVNASGHWPSVTFSSLSNCSSEVQSTRPIILLPSCSEPRSSRAISVCFGDGTFNSVNFFNMFVLTWSKHRRWIFVSLEEVPWIGNTFSKPVSKGVSPSVP